MPNISAYVRRWADEVTGEPVIEVRIEGAHDAPAEAMAAAAYAAARVAIVEFSARRRNGEPPASDGDSSGVTTNPKAPRPPAPGDTDFTTMRGEFVKEGHANDDWAQLIEQRQKDLEVFRRAFVELPRYDIGARVPVLYPGEPVPSVLGRDAALDTLRTETNSEWSDVFGTRIDRALTGGLARVIKDTDVQYVVDALIHASLSLALVQGDIAFEGSEEGDGRVIDNSAALARINCALCRLGVDPAADLPVREISSCIGRECERRNIVPSTATP